MVSSFSRWVAFAGDSPFMVKKTAVKNKAVKGKPKPSDSKVKGK